LGFGNTIITVLRKIRHFVQHLASLIVWIKVEKSFTSGISDVSAHGQIKGGIGEVISHTPRVQRNQTKAKCAQLQRYILTASFQFEGIFFESPICHDRIIIFIA
jgi:hypothetical protein